LLHRTQLPDEFTDRIFTVGDRAQAAYLTIGFHYRCSNRLGVDIQPKNRNFSLMTGSSVCGSGLRSSNKLSLTHDPRSGPVTT
jgi:hypothetical protein